MNKCPTCGNTIQEETNSQNKPWTDFEFSEPNLCAFMLIFEKTLMYLKYNDLFEREKPQALDALAISKLTNQRMPFDLRAKLKTISSGIYIPLCAILEYLHDKKIGPDTPRLRDTKIKTLSNNVRHECAHILEDQGRVINAFKKLDEMGTKETFEQVSSELFTFVIEGLDRYLELGLIYRADIGNTEESCFLLRQVNFRRSKDGREPI